MKHFRVFWWLAVVLIFTVTPVLAMPDGWTNDKRLTSNSGQSLYPSVTCDLIGTTVYAAWMDDRNGYWEIYFCRSFDRGKTWSTDTNITNNAGASTSPYLTWQEPNILLLTWLDYRGGSGDIYGMQSMDDGSTWTDLSGNPGQTTNISNRGNPAVSFSRPRATMNPLGIHVVWADNSTGNSLIYYRNVAFPPTVCIKPDSISATLPAIACRNYSWPPHNNDLFIVWEEGSGPNSSIYFTPSQDAGLTRIDGNYNPGYDDISHKFGSSTARHPDVFVCGDTAAGVDVAFLDDRQGSDQVYWEAGRLNPTPTPISWDSGFMGMGAAPNTITTTAITPQWLSVSPRDGSHQSIIWQDNRDSNNEIYICEGMGGGAIMFTPPQRLTYDGADSILPAIISNDAFAASGPAEYHVVWSDNRDSNYEIYYKRSDIIGPDSIQDLAAVAGSHPGEVDLTWSAPDDNICVRAICYDIGHDADAIGSLFEYRTEAVKIPQNLTPQSPGQTENFTVTGLTPGNAYFFAVISVDEAGNSSTVSNSPSASACGTFTATPTYSHSPTITVTPSITPTGTITLTPTESGTYTSTPTITLTGTITLTPTESGTYTSTPTITQTGTVSLTTTESGTYTSTPTITQTGTVSLTPMESGTYTSTPTITQTGTITLTPTITSASPSSLAGAELKAYPNPGTKKITFSYYLEKPGRAVFNIYNMSGEKVVKLEESKNEYGTMVETIWNTTDLAAGIYIVKLQIIFKDGARRGFSTYRVAIVRE